MNHLLIIDDNIEIQTANSEYLTRRGYSVDMAMNAKDAFVCLSKNKYDCIVLDVMLPDLDGYALCAAARHDTQTPIIFLSCMDGEDSRIEGLMAGGDDYMTKPYSLKELAARIHAQIRRDKVLAGGKNNVESPAPNVLYNKESRTIAIGGVNLIMSHKECEILTRLLANPNEIVTKKDLLDLVEGEEASLAVYIQRIRSKLAMDKALGSIATVFGEGYQYKQGNEAGI